MKRMMFLVIMLVSFTLTIRAQETPQWTAADRKYLVENLTRSRDELLRETKDLTKAQWSFKESPDRWSINEIVEHIAIWELLMTHDVSRQLAAGPHPELGTKALPDSVVYGFIMEDEKHVSTDYTKPFTYTLPMGINELKNNVLWLMKMRNESIQYVSQTSDDLRAYYSAGRPRNTHQTYITLFGHTDRHLRQIRKVKQHPNYPKGV